MFTCYACGSVFGTTVDIIKHIRSNCPKSAEIKQFHCGEPNCLRHFGTLNSLRYHYTRCHNLVTNNSPGCSKLDIVSSNTDNVTSQCLDSPNDERPNEISSPDQSPPSQVSLEKEFASLVSGLYSANNVPRSVVNSISKTLDSVISMSKDIIMSNFEIEMENQGIDLSTSTTIEVKRSLENVLSKYQSSMSNLKTEHRCFEFFQNLGTLVMPAEVVIGERMEHKRNSQGFGLVPTPCTMQIIPLQPILQKFLQIPGLLKEITSKISSFKHFTSGIENIMQGTVWLDLMHNEESSPSSDLHLPLILYFDDFEIGNPLGSHASVHKLGGVYVSLPFLPDHCSSQLKSIFLLALFHSSDRQTFGNKVVFSKICEQLNILSEVGIEIQTDDFHGTVKFHVVCVTGDNLGLNGILGFVESFSANHYCRMCTAHKDRMQVMLTEDVECLRTEDSYEEDVRVNNPSVSGVKEQCVFVEKLKGFRLFENVAVDILHDFLEGVCRYVMCFVIEFLVIESKIVTLSFLQSKLVSFDYGPDSSSKPSNCIVVEGGKVKLKTSASEMMTLVRYFGVMIGYNIPENSDCWNLYTYLRQILDRLLNNRVSPDSVEQLNGLIAGLNELYLKLSKSHLKPKFHFLTHYPGQLLKFGPLCQLWTMRFEAKHRVFKIAARASASRVNVCKTIAIKNQLILNDMFVKNERFEVLSFGKKQAVSDDVKKIIASQLNHEEDLIQVPWVILCGNKIQKQSVLTVDLCLESFLPIFGEVTNIFLNSENKVLFCFNMFETKDFNGHLYAFNVSKVDCTKVLKSTDLQAVVPNTLTVMSDHEKYVTVRMPFD